jgi:hypothetical protein
LHRIERINQRGIDSMRDHQHKQRMHARFVTVCLVLVAGCSNLATTAPQGKDLSGHWILNHEQSDPLPAINPSRGRGGTQREGRTRRGRGVGGGFVDPSFQFPVLATQEMVIEQDASSMGIDYGGGSYRDVSWGERERGRFDVDAGWNEDGNLVVRMQSDDIDYKETYRLSEDGARLTLRIEISGEHLSDVDFVRSYDRKNVAP